MQSTQLDSQAKDVGRLRISLAFEALCLALLRNEPSISSLPDSFSFPDGYAKPLGNALQQNSSVSSIDICLELPAPLFVENAETVTQYVQPLLEHIRTSEAMRKVRVLGFHANKTVEFLLSRLFLRACLCSQSIQELAVHTSFVPALAFRNLTSSRSLRTLYIKFSDRNLYSATDRQAIGEAFASFSALENLEIDITDPSLFQSILVGLRGGECNLGKLRLRMHDMEGTPGLWSDFSLLLRAPAKVNRLCFSFVTFNTRSMTGLISGLRQDGSLPPLTVSALSFSNCSFDANATRLLLEFMHAKIELIVGMMWSLRELNVVYHFEFSNELSSRTLVSMLCMQDAPGNNPSALVPTTIGSHIATLSSDPSDEDLLPLLADNAHRMHLRSLSVSVSKEDIAALVPCISAMKSLRELVAHTDKLGVYPVLVCLKENGTLHSVSVFCDGEPMSKRLTLAISERNQFLHPLLHVSVSTCSDDLDSNGVSESCADKQPNAQHGAGCTTMPLCPTLLQVAMYIPCTRSATLLRTMTSLREHIGIQED